MIAEAGVRRRVVVTSAFVGLVAVVAACAGAGADTRVAVERSADAPTTSTTIAAPPTTTATTTPPPTTTTTTTATTGTTVTTTLPAPPPTAAPATTRPFVERVVTDTGFAPYAVVEGVTLRHPAAGVERIGFHESGHDGARQQDPTATAVRPMTLESRDRGTGDRTAADIVVVPDTEIRAPVTGTVVRSGTYTLYCDHVDEYAVIEPDDRPGWEVKVFHVVGLRVATGQWVEAGVTPLAAHGRILPFESQVDEFTAEPSWPHVHVEIVDPSIPDRPGPGGGCG